MLSRITVKSSWHGMTPARVNLRITQATVYALRYDWVQLPLQQAPAMFGLLKYAALTLLCIHHSKFLPPAYPCTSALLGGSISLRKTPILAVRQWHLARFSMLMLMAWQEWYKE